MEAPIRMLTKLEQVTPQRAVAFLKRNTNNYRKIIQADVDYYAKEMSSDRWRITHQGIAFDVNGKLSDGQHRLLAIIKSETTQWINISYTVPLDAEEATDNQKARTMSDRVHLKPRIVSAAGFMISLTDSEKHRISPEDIKLLVASPFGEAAEKLLDYAPVKRKFFGSATIMAAASVTMLDKPAHRQYVMDLYHHLTMRSVAAEQQLPKIGIALQQKIMPRELSLRLTGAKVGFATGRYVFDYANRDKTRVILSETMITNYIERAKDLVWSIFVPK